MFNDDVFDDSFILHDVTNNHHHWESILEYIFLNTKNKNAADLAHKSAHIFYFYSNKSHVELDSKIRFFTLKCKFR